MEQHDIARMLASHRRRWWWPSRCRCGRRYPCNARGIALDERLRRDARAAIETYRSYFANPETGTTRWV